MKLAEMISSDLKKRLNIGQNQLQPITLQSIANLYKVSITPVKEVVNQLLEEGILIKNKNGRLSYANKIEPHNIQPGRDGILEHPSIDPPKIVSPLDDVTQKIREWIIISTLSGHVHDINELELANKHGINRSRLRQILMQISQESWIVHIPHRGWQVRPLCTKDIQDYVEVRELMEIKAFELCEEKFDLIRVQQLIDNNTNVDAHGSPNFDDSIHQYFCELADNAYVTKFFNLNGKYYSHLFHLAAMEASKVKEMADQHCQILEPIKDKNFKAAKAVLKKHIRTQEENVRIAIDRLKGQAS